MFPEHFVMIRQAYNDFYKDMMLQGKVPYKDTGVGHWVMSASDDAYELFKKIQLQKSKSFLDMGSGDGKVVFIASLFTNAHGIEHDDELMNHAQQMRNKLMHIPHVHKANLMKGNFMQHDLSNYDYVYWYPDKQHQQLDNKFKDELKGKLIVHGPMHHPLGLTREQTFDVNGTLMTIYRS
jgi:protein-L-isoaspartate O-methyltransferase